MILDQWLQRLNINSTIKTDLKTLKLIQKQYLLTVPFEKYVFGRHNRW
jgi:arylamine N-acetyltransferase